jgi:uncharacterized repeat protein (TIGR01451 family)
MFLRKRMKSYLWAEEGGLMSKLTAASAIFLLGTITADLAMGQSRADAMAAVSEPTSTGSTWQTDYDLFITAIEPYIRKGDATSAFILLGIYGRASVTWGGTLQSVTANSSGVDITTTMSPRTYITPAGIGKPWGPLHMTSQPPNSNAWRAAAIGSTVLFKTTTADTVIDTSGSSTNPAVATQGNSELLTPAASPALKISSIHVGSFIQGQSTGAYTLSVQNTGTAVTFGAVTVTDTLPAGLTATAVTGPGWTCSVASLMCSRTDPLAAGGSYPPITVTVSVASNSVSLVTNQVNASGGGNPATATASDPTTILAAFGDPGTFAPFVPFIDLLGEYGITSGCGAAPPMYCPNANITLGQMAVFVVRSVMGGDGFAYTQTPYFSDVPATYPFFPWIQKMQDLGIAQPCGPSQFCPESAVTRGIMAVLIIRGRYGVSVPTNYPATPIFTDVGTTHPYFPWIQKMSQLGITSGCGPATYCPDNPVTRGEMAVFLMKGLFDQSMPATTPILVWASPANALPGQTALVTIMGQNTNFSGSTQVSAGAGVTVSNVTVSNATTLTAQLTVAAGAALGPRSITVTTGSEEATLPSGFRVGVAQGATNLALGKAATQSSTLAGYTSAGAGSAVDGNTDGSFADGSVTTTNLDANAWWQVDLGASTPVGSIKIWNRTDCCGTRLNDYWVFVSDTPFLATDTPTTLQSRAGTFGSHQTTAPNPSTSIAAGAQGRYVRVQLTGTNNLSLAEVQVFGQ